MKILREYLGGSEIIDLDTEEGRADFALFIVQDQYEADLLIERIEMESEVIVNADEAEYVERYSKVIE